MTEPTVFTSATTDGTTVTPVVPPVTTSVPQELQEFVGVGKKYATVEDALKSVPHAQKHISTVEQELAQLKEELTKRKTTEELLEELKASGMQTTSTTADNKSTFTPEQIKQMINETLSATENQKTVKANTESVVAVFKEKFGDKAEEIFINIAKENDLSIQTLNSLAGTSPSAVLKLAGITKKEQTTAFAKLKSDVNTETYKPNTIQQSSARVSGTGTKDLVDAWKRAGAIIGKTT